MSSSDDMKTITIEFDDLILSLIDDLPPPDFSVQYNLNKKKLFEEIEKRRNIKKTAQILSEKYNSEELNRMMIEKIKDIDEVYKNWSDLKHVINKIIKKWLIHKTF